MPSDQIKFALGWKEIQFSKHSTSLRKRKGNYEIIIPQSLLYFCRGLSIGNYKCKIETLSINTNWHCSDLKKNYCNHARLTQEKIFIQFIHDQCILVLSHEEDHTVLSL